MTRMIITADDYGMCEPVNTAIDSCLKAGTVQATCVMPNMESFEESSTLRTRFPRVSVGVHWNLTLGKPVLLPSKIPSLVNSEGYLLPASEFRNYFLRRQISLAEVKAELIAQYERFSQVVGEPDFWNTHQNIHLYPILFHLLVELGVELKIPAMRCHRRVTVPKEMTALRYYLTHPLFWIKGVILSVWANQAESRGMILPAGVLEMPGGEVGKGSFEKLINRIPRQYTSKPIELIIHPATSIQENLFGPLTNSRIKEFNVFSDKNLLQRLGKRNIELVNFSFLKS